MTEEIEQRLFALADPAYRLFQAKLMPTVDPERIIGVRTPLLRALAKEYKNHPCVEEFLSDLPHRYIDENNLHGFLISELRDYRAAVEAVDAFLPEVDNWATCDLLSPKAFRKHHDLLPAEIDRWIASERPFTVRFGLEMMLSHFLDEDFDVRFLDRAASIRSEEYYVNMMIAWLFATALTKQWESTVPFLVDHRLGVWVHNKTIQKAVESYRIPAERKSLLRSYKCI